MCFKNLPVDFDENGKATLREDFAAAYDTLKTRPGGGVATLSQDQVMELLKRNGHIKEFNIDPVTRVAGALAFHTVADLRERRVLETNSLATLFRGYEIILQGRDPRDAIYISSRACGVCGGVHSTCSALALEMAFGVKPPPLGIVVRNLGLAAEFLYDHPLHLGLLAGPDYSQQAIMDTNPEVWERAVKAPAPHSDTHGFSTIGEIMVQLNPLTGSLYLESLEMTRLCREMYVILHAKYPHPQTIVPGGVTSTVDSSSFTQYYTRLVTIFDYAKKLVTLWDDLIDFLYEVNPDYRKVGQRPMNLIDVGIWDDPEAYDATYENADAWGEQRMGTPGVVVDGELRTTKLTQINMGIEEFVDHSFYEDWTKPATNGNGNGSSQHSGSNGHSNGSTAKANGSNAANGTYNHPVGTTPYPTDPLGNPLSPYHMWNKLTIPKPGGTSWKERYSWDTAPRWDRLSMEAGAYARLWTTAAAKLLPKNSFLESTGHSLKMLLPKAALPEMELEWHIPKTWGAFERNRARAYCFAYTSLVAMDQLQKAWDYMKKGQTAVHTKFTVPQNERLGVGFWGAGRGFLTHHAVIDKGRIKNYQILTPSTWNAAPRDPFGNPGPYEEAVLNTPLLENFEKPEDFKGIDILRTIRSFDPCMPCTTHIYADNKLVVSREVNTCACGLD